MQDNNAYEAPMTTGHLEKKPNAKKPSTLVRLLEVFGVLFIIGVLIGMLLPAVQSPRGPAPRTYCLNNLRQIAIAMLNYETANGHFPPAYIADESGKPIHSWRVLLLPYLEEGPLYDQYSFDEPWDGPNNSKLHDEIVEVYRCPSDQTLNNNSINGASYMVVTGQGTAFDGDHEVTLKEVGDGSSNTLLLVEVKHPKTHWMEPVDLTLAQASARFTDPAKVEQCCNHPGGINVSLMDGSTHSISLPISAENLKALATRDDGEIVSISDL